MRTAEEKSRILAFVRQKMTTVYETARDGAHGTTHPQRLEKIADIIADPDQVDLFLLKIAIWCHDIHRVDTLLLPEKVGIRFILNLLFHSGLTNHEVNTVIDAVIKHDELNEASDDPVLVYLKDIDRLDMGAIGILRTIAYCHRFTPYALSDFGDESEIDTDHPKTIVQNLHRCLKWENMLRTPGAKILAKKRFAFMRQFLKELERELEELGVIP